MYKGYIYRHWIVNEEGIEKNYIGQTIKKPEQRWGVNGKGYMKIRKKDGNVTEFANAIKKYGWDNFNHKVLFSIKCETEEELGFWLDEWEKYYIWKYDSFYNGYNSTLGGKDGIKGGFQGKHHTKEWKQQQSETKKGLRTDSQVQQMKPVICLNTLQKFDCIADAQKWCKVEGRGISNCCKGKVKHSGKHPITKELLRWMWQEEWDSLNEQQKLEAQQQKINGKTLPKKVICLQTLEVFNTCGEASEWCNGNVSQYFCKNTAFAGTHPKTGEKLAWAYFDEYENMTKEEIDNRIQKAKYFSFVGENNPTSKKVICLNTLQVFKTVTDACTWCGCGKGNLSNYCKDKMYIQDKTRGKHPETGEPLKWMYYSDYLEQQNKDKSDSKIA